MHATAIQAKHRAETDTCPLRILHATITTFVVAWKGLDDRLVRRGHLAHGAGRVGGAGSPMTRDEWRKGSGTIFNLTLPFKVDPPKGIPLVASTHSTNGTMRIAPLLTSLLLPLVAEGAFFKKKHRRQKAGTKYNAHDAVHIVVNKVG